MNTKTLVNMKSIFNARGWWFGEDVEDVEDSQNDAATEDMEVKWSPVMVTL